MSTPSSSSSTQSISDFIVVLTESTRIINAHSRHFLSLSLLFLLPLSFSLFFYPTLFHTLASPAPHHILSLLRLPISHPPFFLHHHPHNTLFFTLLFISFLVLLSVCAIGSVTYSVFHGFYGRPVKFFTALKSLLHSFTPLLITFVTTQIVIFVIFCVFWGIGVVGVRVSRLIFGEFSYNSPYFIWVSVIWAVVLVSLLVYVSVSWYLIGVIVVIESKWGFKSMVRSTSLMRGMRWVGFCLIMYLGLIGSALLWLGMVLGNDEWGSGFVMDGWGWEWKWGWRTWGFVLRIVGSCVLLTLVMLHSIAASTVLYMYCKALHGELASEIANEFSAEYVSLPFEDKKVPHVVYFVQ